ncbi:MAG: mannosyltransferase family protein [Pseudomonadota bacterium]
MPVAKSLSNPKKMVPVQLSDAGLLANPILFCVTAFLVSRTLLTCVGYLAYMGHLPLAIAPTQADNMVLANPWLDMWFAWDSQWYLTILSQGYQSEVILEAGPSYRQANWAFFPLYPSISALLTTMTGTNGAISLLLVANLAFLAALLLVYTEIEQVKGAATAKLAVIILLAWPGTHFFSSAYAESLFLLLVVSTFRFARQKRFLAAPLVAALAAITRSPGIMLVFPIAFYAWSAWACEQGHPQSVTSGFQFALSVAGLRTFLTCCLPVLSLCGFMAHLYHVTGDALAFATIQEAWGRSFKNPVMEFFRPFLAPATIPPEIWPDFLTMFLLPAPLILLFRERDWPYFSFALILCLLAISAGVVSLNRQTLVIYPIVLVVATALSKNPVVACMFIAVTTIAALALMAFWSAGYGII